MEEILSIINIVGVIGATVISAITLFSTKQLQKAQQQTDIMSKKRSDRIDLMRKYSAQVISCGKQFLYGIDTEQTKRDLICATDNFISLLQYAYEHDVEMIDTANKIVELCLNPNSSKDEIENVLNSFWLQSDVYVGVEHERLKIESMGNIIGSGEVGKETNIFENLHKNLTEEQTKYVKK